MFLDTVVIDGVEITPEMAQRLVWAYEDSQWMFVSQIDEVKQPYAKLIQERLIRRHSERRQRGWILTVRGANIARQLTVLSAIWGKEEVRDGV